MVSRCNRSYADFEQFWFRAGALQPLAVMEGPVAASFALRSLQAWPCRCRWPFRCAEDARIAVCAGRAHVGQTTSDVRRGPSERQRLKLGGSSCRPACHPAIAYDQPCAGHKPKICITTVSSPTPLRDTRRNKRMMPANAQAPLPNVELAAITVPASDIHALLDKQLQQLSVALPCCHVQELHRGQAVFFSQLLEP